MSIPVRQRELSDGWALTCRGEDGGDLTLSDVIVKKENLRCQVLGGELFLFPLLVEGRQFTSESYSYGYSNDDNSFDERDDSSSSSSSVADSRNNDNTDDDGNGQVAEAPILEHIRGLILQAQKYGCWQPDLNEVEPLNGDDYHQHPNHQRRFPNRSIRKELSDLPLSHVLTTGIDLWQNDQIDDDELLEIAIRDVSYQIRLQQEREEGIEMVLDNVPSPSSGEGRERREGRDVVGSTSPSPTTNPSNSINSTPSSGTGTDSGKTNDGGGDDVVVSESVSPLSSGFSSPASSRSSSITYGSSNNHRRGSFVGRRHKFNPKVDPTILFLEMKQLSLHLDKFEFQIEKLDKTIFDPSFVGWASLSVENVSIKVRVECRKHKIQKLGQTLAVPVLQCQELGVSLGKVFFQVKDTGADWVLNKAVEHFSASITEVVETNLREQVQEQLNFALENLNSYFAVNPDLMLSILGITMDDLEENAVWV